jgi:hypothetical protein
MRGTNTSLVTAAAVFFPATGQQITTHFLGAAIMSPFLGERIKTKQTIKKRRGFTTQVD